MSPIVSRTGSHLPRGRGGPACVLPCCGLLLAFVLAGTLAWADDILEFRCDVFYDTYGGFLIRVPHGFTPAIGDKSDIQMVLLRKFSRGDDLLWILRGQRLMTESVLAGIQRARSERVGGSSVGREIGPEETSSLSSPTGRWSITQRRFVPDGGLASAVARVGPDVMPLLVWMDLAPGSAAVSLESFHATLGSLRLMSLSEEANAEYQRAYQAMESGSLKAAVKKYDRVLELAPGFVPAMNEKGVALRRLGRLDEAQSVLRSALEAAPDNYHVKRTLLNTMFDTIDSRRKGQPEGSTVKPQELQEIRQLYPGLLECFPEDTQLFLGVGWRLTATDANDEAVAVLETAAERWPENAIARVDLGVAYAATGRPDDALMSLCQAGTMPGMDANNVKYAAGALLSFLKSHPDLVPDPKNPLSACERIASLEDREGARGTSGSVASSQPPAPDDPIALLAQAGRAHYAEPRDPAAAEKLYLQALARSDSLPADSSSRLQPEFVVHSWAGIGIARHEQGRYDDAAEAFEKAISLPPGDTPEIGLGELHYNLACALARSGKKNEALGELRVAANDYHYPGVATAGNDEDLAALREEPEFKAIVGRQD